MALIPVNRGGAPHFRRSADAMPEGQTQLDTQAAQSATPGKPQVMEDDQLSFEGPEDETSTFDKGEDKAELDLKNEDILAALGGLLDAKFQSNERKRMYIEDRWLEDLRQYHGVYDPSVEAELRTAQSCALFLNMTRPKTNGFAARVMDMVLPTDEKNWGIEHTPVPELTEASELNADQPIMVPGGPITKQPQPPQQPVQQSAPAGAPSLQGTPAAGTPAAPGQPPAAPMPGAVPGAPPQPEAPPTAPVMTQAPDGTLTPLMTPDGHPVLQKDLVQGVKDEAKARAERMEEEIDDQLQETKWNGIQRQCIDQMAKLGTSVVMGPAIMDEWVIKWVPQPRIDPATNQKVPGKFDYVRKRMPNVNRRPGAQWVDVWNFYPDMTSPYPDGWDFVFVQAFVNDGEFRKYARRFNFDKEATKRALAGGRMNIMAMRWMLALRDMSETQNFVDERYRLLRYFGEITPDDLRAIGKDPEDLGLEGEAIFGQVWLCNGIVLKIDLNPLDSGALPFSVAYCDKDEASPFGIGIPRAMRGEQDSINSSWRMIHDNGGLSVGPQTIMRAGAVVPADGDFHLKPKKMWYASSDTVKVQDVFAQFTVDSHQQELSNILNLGIRFADDVTQLPLIMQGDQAPHITQTAQGMSILYNSSTVVLRRTVKLYDDWMIEPTITRFYEWNMQFNPRDDIKGDMRCVARGSSTLLDKEQQGQAFDTAMQMAMQPTWQPYTDMKKLYRQAMKAKRIDDIVLPDDQIDKNLADQAKAAADAAAAKNAAGQDKQQVDASQPDPVEQAKVAAMQDANQVKREQIQSNERIAISRLASTEKISLTEATTRFAAIKLAEDGANQRFNADSKLKQMTGSGIA